MTSQQTGKLQIGGYQVLARISSGGMGDVMLVRRIGVHGFEKLAAIKIIRSNVPNFIEMRTMFLDEARLMARLNHPIIAQVYDFGEEANRLYLVMEYVAGISFDTLIDHRPPPVIAARAMAGVCLGLHAAHRLTDLSGMPLGVVHRDVSPQNLMLNFDGCVKILDFGIALMRDRETLATQCGQIKGKPAYMAPEQLKNQPMDHRTDIFAASVVLYELLTGHRLFVGDNVYAVAKSIEESIIVPPSHLVGVLPPGLDDVVMRGLDRDPDRRFQSALDMAQTLGNVVAKTEDETLEQYATHDLAQDRLKHLEWLQQAIFGTEGQDGLGRSKDVKTAPLKFTCLTVELADPVVTPDYLIHADINTTGVAPRRFGRKTALRLFLFVLLAGLSTGAMALFWDRGRPEKIAGPIRTQPVVPEQEPAPAPEPEPPPVLDLEEEEEPAVKPKKKSKPRRRRVRRTGMPKTTVLRSPETVLKLPERVVVPPQTFGLITIATEPYANVRIDGKEVGTTPIFRRKITVGQHEIVLISPDTGSVRYRQKVHIVENQLKKVILK
jgi:serine/threonine protein kinase